MRAARIAIAGHVCIDYNQTERQTYVGWGSAALYIASFLQDTLHNTPDIITRCGQDFASYAAQFRLHGMANDSSPTLRYENSINGSTRQWRCRNLAAASPPPLGPAEIRLLNAADIFFFTPLTPHYSAEAVQALTSHLPAHCLKVCCPQGYFRHIQPDGTIAVREFVEAASVLPQFDVAVYSTDDHAQALSLANEWTCASDYTCIVTAGAHGAYIVQAGTRQLVPTEPVAPEAIIDSVGCGDTFTAAMAYELYSTGDLQAAVTAGNKAARRKLQRAA